MAIWSESDPNPTRSDPKKSDPNSKFKNPIRIRLSRSESEWIWIGFGSDTDPIRKNPRSDYYLNNIFINFKIYTIF